MGIKVCSNQGDGPFWAQIEVSDKYSFYKTMAHIQNAEIWIIPMACRCAAFVPGVT